MDSQGLLLLNIFDHHDFTAKHCYFGCSKSSDVNGIKILIKMTRPQNIVLSFYVLRPGRLYQKFWSHQHQETSSIRNNNVLQWGHDDQTKLSKAGGLGCPFRFHTFSTRPFSSWPFLFYTYRVFWFKFHFFWKITICTSKKGKVLSVSLFLL